jgi:hypothetical protein
VGFVGDYRKRESPWCSMEASKHTPNDTNETPGGTTKTPRPSWCIARCSVPAVLLHDKWRDIGKLYFYLCPLRLQRPIRLFPGSVRQQGQCPDDVRSSCPSSFGMPNDDTVVNRSLAFRGHICDCCDRCSADSTPESLKKTLPSSERNCSSLSIMAVSRSDSEYFAFLLSPRNSLLQ